MDKNEILTLIQFNFWANGRILEACDRISAEKRTRKLNPDPGWGDLLSILVHILDTEYGWRSLLQSQSAEIILDAADFEDLTQLRTRWEMERSSWLAYANLLSQERINQGFGPDPDNGLKVWQTIMHVLGHGIQHRSEAAAILTGYGQSPGELDFGVFLKEKPANI